MPGRPVYEPIGPEAIRLLLIAPGFASETINCTLIVIEDRNNAPEYDAISYVWGTELSDEPIMCNGHRMTVTKNLAKAMRYLRPLPNWDSVITWSKDHQLHSSHNAWGSFATNRQEEKEKSVSQQERPIWIDALCINQEDMAEKENQVKRMHETFADAVTVKIWLGEANDSYRADSLRLEALKPKGIPTLRQQIHIGQYGSTPVVLAFIAQALRNVHVGRDYPTASKADTNTAYRNLVHGFPKSDAVEWEFLRDFFDNPWFERIWVVQEVVHAKRAVAILGDWQIEWEALGQAATWFQAHGFALPSDVQFNGDKKDLLPVSKISAMWHITGNRRPLLRILRELRGRKATLKVDKVYAAYSLAEETICIWENNQQFDPLIEPTYDPKRVDEVYPNVIRFLVIYHGDLAALSHAGGIQGVKTSGCPSWVPDWNQSKISTEFVNDNRDESPYNASGNEHLFMGDSIDPACLSVRGIKVSDGSIRAYGDKLISYGFRHTSYKEEHDFVKSAWNLVAHLAKRGDASGDLNMYHPENIPHTFVSTLSAGLTETRQLVDEDSNFLDDAADWLLQQFGGQIPVSGVSKKWRLPGAIWNYSSSGRFREAFTRACLHRRFFVTAGNLMGIGPETMERNDIIVILFGGKVPYVVRELGEGKYSFIGECYVPGLMTGEAVEQWKKSGRIAEFFNLV
ncbi:heterokaryon incompatibility protein-domain-containing protein [Annulohypoxylon maeteangense]|uniref:heterokaryon incompatibility protein-domain-containing protein n=1 Tax=Annulohypoxylon maeteangense TaxID=1927788 RepID=UPI002007E499|nr:heterokaryon incompatibility protein-domain-containing protein [Annulohypoxylon maeteangense]KAI0888041.1 heterokaryon incompatibility protein-domain-containing protein [Annulohypoxylon maeteangense]